jgi:hypothetical protein
MFSFACHDAQAMSAITPRHAVRGVGGRHQSQPAGVHSPIEHRERGQHTASHTNLTDGRNRIGLIVD